jgi:hypothetical protein
MFVSITKTELQELAINYKPKSHTNLVADFIYFFRDFVIIAAQDGKNNATYYFVDDNCIINTVITQLKILFHDCDVSTKTDKEFTVIIVSWIN